MVTSVGRKLRGAACRSRTRLRGWVEGRGTLLITFGDACGCSRWQPPLKAAEANAYGYEAVQQAERVQQRWPGQPGVTELAQEARASRPDSPEIADTLGYVYLRRNLAEAALVRSLGIIAGRDQAHRPGGTALPSGRSQT